MFKAITLTNTYLTVIGTTAHFLIHPKLYKVMSLKVLKIHFILLLMFNRGSLNSQLTQCSMPHCRKCCFSLPVVYHVIAIQSPPTCVSCSDAMTVLNVHSATCNPSFPSYYLRS